MAGNNKSIDDIIKLSDFAQFLSEAQSDATNVETSGKPIRQMLPNRTDMDTMFDLFYPPSEDEKMMKLKKILQDLAKPKPIDT